MDLTPNDGKVMVALFDGTKAKPLTWKDRRVTFYIDECGFPIYITEKDHARQVCSRMPNRFKLYRSPELDTQVVQPNGAKTWETINSWFYVKNTVEDGLEDNGETKYRQEITWVIDKTQVQTKLPSVEFITGKKLPEEAQRDSATLNVLRLDKLNKEVLELKEAVTMLQREVSLLKTGKTEAERPLNRKG